MGLPFRLVAGRNRTLPPARGQSCPQQCETVPRARFFSAGWSNQEFPGGSVRLRPSLPQIPGPPLHFEVLPALSKRMRLSLFPAIALALAVAGCSSPRREHTHASPPPAPEPYIRVLNADSNLVQLQIAVRKFVPNRGPGPAVWLFAVSHIGETNYFASLQQQLDTQDLVLFEGVGEHPDRTAASTNAPVRAATPREDSRSSLQDAMAAALGLEFQLDAIDYNNPHFQNSDLSLPQLRKLMAEVPKGGAGGGRASQDFESLLQMMQGGGLFDSLLRMGMSVLGADPELRAMSKLVLVESLAQIQGDPSQLRGLPPDLTSLLDVLVQERNRKVIEDLQARLKDARHYSSIALLYGSGHMPNMETRLRRDLKYRPAEQLWLTAFSVDLRQAGISPAQRQFIHNLVKSEMEPLQRAPAARSAP